MILAYQEERVHAGMHQSLIQITTREEEFVLYDIIKCLWLLNNFTKLYNRNLFFRLFSCFFRTC